MPVNFMSYWPLGIRVCFSFSLWIRCSVNRRITSLSRCNCFELYSHLGSVSLLFIHKIFLPFYIVCDFQVLLKAINSSAVLQYGVLVRWCISWAWLTFYLLHAVKTSAVLRIWKCTRLTLQTIIELQIYQNFKRDATMLVHMHGLMSI